MSEPEARPELGPEAAAATAAESEPARMQAALEECIAAPFVGGNRVERLRNGDEIFPAMLAAIRRARRRIDFETFIYWSGDIADRFADALIDAAERGVEVRVLLDAVGSIPMSASLRERLASSRVDVREFRPPVRWRWWEIDNRTHRKILVADEVGFTGGVGIGEEWTGDARNPDEWRESHFAIEGPVVRHLAAAFVEHWIEAVDPAEVEGVLRAAARSGDAAPGPAGDAAVQLLRSRAGVGWTDVQILLRAVVALAEERLRITSAYFVPDSGMLDLLCEAADRGVTVEVLNPGPHTDHRLSQLAGEDVYHRLLAHGVRIYRYQPTMLHAKVITVDGILSVVGSANFNYRSFARDDEICLSVIDRELTARLDEDFDHDLLAAKVVDDRTEWTRRGPLQRVGEWFARRLRFEL